MPKYWTCPCGTRNERIKQKCANIECRRKRPKSRTKTLAHPQDDYRAVYVPLAAAIHGVTDESCCVCGRPRSQAKHHDRDHDHRTGAPRGIACFHCNKELLRHATLEQARLVVAYLERVEAHYSKAAA
jgi:Recombination endonuclease VII